MDRIRIDMHCDSLVKAYFDGIGDIYDAPDMMFDFRRFGRSGGGIQFTAVFFPPRRELEKGTAAGKDPSAGGRPDHMPEDMAFFEEVRKIWQNTAERHPGEVEIVRAGRDVSRILEAGQEKGPAGMMLTMEDGRAAEGKEERIRYFFDCGVRLITLTWNHENCFGYPNSDRREIMEKGLKPFGREMIGLMNELGILIDVSHLSDGGFWDAARISRKPFLASHSNCRALCGHRRNLTDEMIRALGNAGGVMGVNFCPAFLADGEQSVSRVRDIVRHMRHAADVGGTDLLALGSDFDGISGELEVGSTDRTGLIWDEMKRAGFTETEIEKAAFANAARFLKDTLPR